MVSGCSHLILSHARLHHVRTTNLLERLFGRGSSVKGVDFSLRATPIPGWTIGGGVTYAKSKIKSEDPNVQGYDLLGHPVPLVGNEFNFSPDWSGTADTEYRFPIFQPLAVSHPGILERSVNVCRPIQLAPHRALPRVFQSQVS